MIASTITSSTMVTPDCDFNFLNNMYSQNYKGSAIISEAFNRKIKLIFTK